MSNNIDKRLELVIENQIAIIGDHNTTAARQLTMATGQLIESDSIEEYKQIGITVRDAWIEYARSIFYPEFTPNNEASIGSTDAKRMIKYSLNSVGSNTEYLIKMSHNAFDLCNKLEHDTNATFEMALFCISSSTLLMGLILVTMNAKQLLKTRPYYKCPNCGSLKLKIVEHWIQDIEGAFKVDKIICSDCSWSYIEELGGMSGVEEN